MNKNHYLDTIGSIERLQRLYIEIIKKMLFMMDVDDLNPSQAIVILNLGYQQVSVSELSDKGYFLGTNFSYSLKKMVEVGYIKQQVSATDRRATIVELTEKGINLHEGIKNFLMQQSENIGIYGVDNLENLNENLSKLEQFWIDSTFISNNRVNMHMIKKNYEKNNNF